MIGHDVLQVVRIPELIGVFTVEKVPPKMRQKWSKRAATSCSSFTSVLLQFYLFQRVFPVEFTKLRVKPRDLIKFGTFGFCATSGAVSQNWAKMALLLHFCFSLSPHFRSTFATMNAPIGILASRSAKYCILTLIFRIYCSHIKVQLKTNKRILRIILSSVNSLSKTQARVGSIKNGVL